MFRTGIYHGHGMVVRYLVPVDSTGINYEYGIYTNIASMEMVTFELLPARRRQVWSTPVSLAALDGKKVVERWGGRAS